MTTYTYAILEITEPAYQEIYRKLDRAGYSENFHRDGGRIVVDMHGIAIASNGAKPRLMRPDHWVMEPGDVPPPSDQPSPVTRDRVGQAVREAIRACTSNGTEIDFDPDAMVIEVQNRLLGFSANLETRAMGATADFNIAEGQTE